MEQEGAERRKHNRFRVALGMFLSFSPDDSGLVEVIDISMSVLPSLRLWARAKHAV